MKNVLDAGRAVWRALLGLVFPGACLLCGRALGSGDEEHGPVCRVCVGTLAPLSGARCRVCGIPLISEIGRCLRCRGRDFAFNAHRSLFEYRGEVRELIYYFKFRGRAGLVKWFTPFLAAETARAGKPDFIVPVPSAARRRRRRGFSPVGLISRELSHMSRVPLLACLTRVAGEAQKTLDFAQRLSNLQGKIGCRENRAACLRGRTILLLDDIFTTGATVNECAVILKARGAASVSVLTLAMDV
jgi:competence protein ComFC